MCRRWRFGAAIGLVVALAAAGCTPSDARSADRARAAGPPTTSAPSTTASTAPAPTTTTLDLSVLPSCWPDPSFGQPPAAPVPGDLAAALDAFAADARIAPNAASVSVWIDGLGEVLTRDPDVALAPASNQKLLTAMGALAVLGPDTRLATEVKLAPSGDLVIVPGGDPTLASTGPHSLTELAAQVRSAASRRSRARCSSTRRGTTARGAPPVGRTGRSRRTPGRCRH